MSPNRKPGPIDMRAGHRHCRRHAGADISVSAGISQQTAHLVREADMACMAAVHHATERFGGMAPGVRLAEKFGIACEFVDICRHR